jgi:cytochrome c553
MYIGSILIKGIKGEFNNMKKGALTKIFLLSIGLIFLAAGVLTAADVTEKIVIDNKGYSKDVKGPVNFSHLKHSKDYGVACTDCHHEYKDGNNIWKEGDAVKTCVTCHDPEKTQDNVPKLMMAFHNNCKDCHKNSGKDTAPTKCNDCHAK